MSKLDVGTDTELLLFLELEGRSEDPCEHSRHMQRDGLHEGPGEWLVAVKATCDCEATTTILICDKFKRVVLELDASLYCRVCGRIDRGRDVYTILGRKGVDF